MMGRRVALPARGAEPLRSTPEILAATVSRSTRNRVIPLLQFSDGDGQPDMPSEAAPDHSGCILA